MELKRIYNQRLHHDPEATDIDPRPLPSPSVAGGMFAKAKRRSAPGQGGISGDTPRRCPRELARHLRPIYLKTSVHQQEPHRWTRGMVHPLFTGTGSYSPVEFYRSILLNSTVAKCWHRFLRDQVSECRDIWLRSTQCGRMPRKGPSAPAQIAPFS
eukprot:2675576-Pyramimonas_sp.AAC.1